MKKIGLIINPIAGLGGSVGLKGTDNLSEKAIALGGKPKAIEKTMNTLMGVDIDEDVVFYTASGEMGESLLKKMNFDYECIYSKDDRSTAVDTYKCAKLFIEKNIDLLVFAGGDGTARDICNAVDENMAVVGIPAGVKVQSAVFAKNPKKASNLINKFLNGKSLLKKCEVIDLDEDMYRNGVIQPKLYGYLNVPYDKKLLQNKKARSPLSEENNQRLIAYDICDNMENGILYIIGPGSTTKAIMDNLNLKNTLIGVDLIFNKKIYKNDVSEKDILDAMDIYEKTYVIVTPIGGQGYVFGRGNQQISEKVINKIEKEDIFIVATETKLVKLINEPLLIDTGSEETNEKLKGYYKVITGYKERRVMKVSD
ncbi:ATP-NAD kinase family protein [Clostridiaceae bacterium HSG29]|nr:ATP-NAD kinase family protein [Clostridiaceae bacterium HSG29]